ncbi:hypothetical protein KFE25_001578 [Diacronema lutheri]|uniref:Uncharacterized protein n=1 Tax=Diacronema lutheri TaxID=2081491 RepID=A0A8J5XP31_DIALT|nr:hypothetical protein KFE25_001578 [Diacronema lutheri]
MGVVVLVAVALGFVSPGPLGASRVAAPRQAARMSSSGFGVKKIVGKAEAKAGKATKPGAYDNLKKTGVPEYAVFVRAAEGAAWRGAGVLCVPRTASVREAVSKAIYTRENEMCAAVLKAHPDLKAVAPSELQFGFRPVEFESDTIQLATRELAQDKKNFFEKFVEDLNNPVNTEDQ